MLSLLRRFATSSIHVTDHKRAWPLPAVGPECSEGERIIDFFGVRIAFPNWEPEVEEEIRERLSHIKGLTNEGLADAARSMIVEHLERDNPRYIPFADRKEALRAVSAHTWKVLRAQGLVCER
jgi:hypothetical protein